MDGHASFASKAVPHLSRQRAAYRLSSWGKVSDEADARLQTGNVRMSPGDWNSGENYWLLELLAPFGHNNEMLADLQKTIFKGKTFKMHSLENGERNLVTLAGKGAKLNTPPKDATDEPQTLGLQF